MLSGYNVDIDSLFKTFDGEGKDQIVVAKDIEVWSCCEHHLLPFHCSVSVAYLPVKRVIGVSKIARLVQAYAHRFQIQERITSQIGETLMSKLQPQGVAVVIHGEHLCMQARGAKVPSSSVVTSVMLGQFRLERTLRMEVLSLLGLGGH
jgi:GTP cyclohydrolase I